jgi:small subunit ribosomal protein S9
MNIKIINDDEVVIGENEENIAKVYERCVDKFGRSYGTGKRKNAIARVWLKAGKGDFVVNGKTMDTYFARPVLRMIIDSPMKLVERFGSYDVMCTVIGGGLSGQAGAVRHGITLALIKQEPELRGVLKRAGMVTRDSRVVERKKYGRHKARRKPQFCKR